MLGIVPSTLNTFVFAHSGALGILSPIWHMRKLTLVKSETKCQTESKVNLIYYSKADSDCLLTGIDIGLLKQDTPETQATTGFKSSSLHS